MKVGVWSTLCCLLLVTCFLHFSDAMCTDSGSWCREDRCDQPGIQKECMKTCGLCDDEPGQTTCRKGTWGSGCTKSCNVGCLDGVCHKEIGACEVCKPCFEGPWCTVISDRCTCFSLGTWYPATCECKVGWYGERCEQMCSRNCLKKTCDSKGTGSCLQGCTDGWFGDKCEQTCSEGCVKKLCDQETGICTKGCLSGVYGKFCDKSCSSRCRDKACTAARNDSFVGGESPPGDVCTAWCSLGCETGWFGHDCSSPCPPGCESCGREDGRCLKSRVSGLVVWVVLPVLVITLLIIAIVVLVARLIRIEGLKKHTNQMPGFYQGSPEGALSHQGDEVQLLASRDHRPLPPLPGGPSPDTIYSEPMVEAEEPESYIIIRHL